MSGISLDIMTSVVGNLIHFTWLYVLAVEKRYSRTTTFFICALSFIVFQAASLYLFVAVEPSEGSLVLVRHQLGIAGSVVVFALIASGDPLRNAVLYSGYIDFWLLVYIVALLVSHEPTLYGQATALAVLLRTAFHLAGMAWFARVVASAITSRRNWPMGLPEAVLGCFALVFLQLESLLMGNQTSGSILPQTFSVTLLSLAVTALVGWLVVRVALLQERMAQLEKVELQNRYLSAAVARDAEAHEAKMRARHALRDHLRALRSLAQQGENDRVLAYLDDMLLHPDERDALRYSNDSVIDLVARVYAERANAAHAHFLCCDSAPHGLGLDDSNAVVLLSNLLEMALACCVGTDEPFISLTIDGLGAKTLVECTYSCASGVSLVDGWPTGQGLSASALRQLLEECSGDVCFSIEGNRCTCTILLNNSTPATG